MAFKTISTRQRDIEAAKRAAHALLSHPQGSREQGIALIGHFKKYGEPLQQLQDAFSADGRQVDPVRTNYIIMLRDSLKDCEATVNYQLQFPQLPPNIKTVMTRLKHELHNASQLLHDYQPEFPTRSGTEILGKLAELKRVPGK